MKELLARSNEALLLDQVHDAVIATDLQGTIHLWNSGAERIYGYSKSEIVGQPISRRYFPEDTDLLQSLVLSPLESLDLHEVVLRNRRKDGNEVFIDLRVSVVRNRVGKAIGYSGCSNDVTARRRAEEALASAYQDLERRIWEARCFSGGSAEEDWYRAIEELKRQATNGPRRQAAETAALEFGGG